jgi:hypothetical protein
MISKLPGNCDIQGGMIPLFRGVSQRDRVFPLRTPELKAKYIVTYLVNNTYIIS